MRYLKDIPVLNEPSAIALGLFDGVHRGHRAVIKKAVSCAPALTPVVFTFTFDDPDQITKPHYAAILSDTRKREIFASLGVQAVVEPPFSSFRELSPEDFFQRILREKLNAKAVFCGGDYRFGKNAAGDAVLMERFCKEAGIRFETVPSETEGGEPISSTRIRQLLRDGKPEESALLLGERYAIDFPVVHGRQLGRKMGYPTINQLYPSGSLLPKFGVYASMTKTDGDWKRSMTNIGIKPTVNYSGAPLAETFITDFSGDVYGRVLQVVLTDFVRPEMKFPSVDALKKQISADITAIKSM